ncbi:hypothetical protein CMUS01_03557 [Colletotrichum musicola]|uniref:Uncharacterized protein n=2 Tax=Colletotrichum orchidearum species complex TaxID=2707337 RepID=A0A8H6NSA6_9PEZI|nr:hypothetical protein CPLU01_00940 [Colletotrichum plurivorum]KAF6841524.1 hypothetical protein CMUS01_03557 [Colletotrichum musicola]
MKFIFSYIMLALFFGLGLAQQGNIQCQCKANLANSAVRSGGLRLCAQRGGILSEDNELCTRLPQKFSDADCQTLGESFFATCGSARSELKRGIYKREVVPLSTRRTQVDRVMRRFSSF